jgi:hypothetical protein
MSTLPEVEGLTNKGFRNKNKRILISNIIAKMGTRGHLVAVAMLV